MHWTLKLAQLGDPPTADRAQEMIQLARTFRLTIEDVVSEETRGWTAEFQASLAQLEKEAREQVENGRGRSEEREKVSQARAEAEATAQRDASRPGTVEVTVANAIEADDRTVRVHLEGAGTKLDEVLVGATRHVFIGLKPGQYRLVVSGQSGAKPFNDEAACEVLPGQTVKAELRLPIGASGAQSSSGGN